MVLPRTYAIKRTRARMTKRLAFGLVLPWIEAALGLLILLG
jgi:hypothetical protein